MKKAILSLILGLAILPLFLAAGLGIASAHVLKENNGIAGVLHIPPDDNPEANQATRLEESFADNTNKFRLQDCNCKVVIKNNGTIIQTVSLKPAVDTTTLDAVSTVNFPAIGVYDVTVEGNAKDGIFNSFQLDYTVRVSTSARTTIASSSNKGRDIAEISILSLSILIIGAYYVIHRGGRYAPKSNE